MIEGNYLVMSLWLCSGKNVVRDPCYGLYLEKNNNFLGDKDSPLSHIGKNLLLSRKMVGEDMNLPSL